MKHIYERYFKDIRFWILLFFAIRLIGITNPPLEIAHNWRQTTVTMVARNFVEVDSNILYPRIDIAGEKTGITGMEFPLLNYLIYLVSMVFGYEHWYGRLINLIVSSLGLWYFFKLIRKYFHEKQAFYATIILLFSIWFSFSRKIMPDTFAVSLLIAGIYYGSNYLDASTHRFRNAALYMLFVCLGALAKLPAAYSLPLLALPFLANPLSLKTRLSFVILSFFAILPVFYWYFSWVPHLEYTYDFSHFFMGSDFIPGFLEIMENLGLTFKRFYDDALKYVGFSIFLFGCILAIRKKDKRIMSVLVLSSLCFAVVVFKAGFTFSKHSYYVIPFVPIMAFLAGYGLNSLSNKKLAMVLLLLIGLEGIANQYRDFFIPQDRLQLLTLEEELDQLGDRSDLVLINSGEYPTPMYFAHRKGWVLKNSSITPDKIMELKKKGLKYVVILKTYFGKELELDLEKITEKEEYLIYKV